MRLIGLTGSIGMGKSTVAAALRREGLPVFDADAAVHRLFEPGGRVVTAVDAAFGDRINGLMTAAGGIDRGVLGRHVFGRVDRLRRLEAIVHPAVQQEAARFLRRHARHPWVVLDVPLLFEGGMARRVDIRLCVTAPALIQQQRVLGRPGMTRAMFEAILAQQMPDAEKRRRSDCILHTGRPRGATVRALRRLLRRLERKAHTVDSGGWPRPALVPTRPGLSMRPKLFIG